MRVICVYFTGSFSRFLDFSRKFHNSFLVDEKAEKEDERLREFCFLSLPRPKRDSGLEGYLCLANNILAMIYIVDTAFGTLSQTLLTFSNFHNE